MEDYETLLKQAYSKVKVVGGSLERFEIPKVEGMISGKNTIITNISAIACYIRRPVEPLVKFLQKELATPGKIENDRLILNTKLNSIKVNEKILQYTKEFVICNECKKPDTEIITEKGIKLKHCLACGAKSPVRSII
jgi:translation initiation factor 2 subunit 2